MMLRMVLAISLIVLSLVGFSQQNLTGKVFNAENNTPLPYTTIYQNGTTNGTISDVNGVFSLENLTFPCEIVISHIGYKTSTLSLNEIPKEPVKLTLSPQNIQLKEVQVYDENFRRKNLQLFRDLYLGTDKFGKKAYIKNEDVLVFKWEYEERSIKVNPDMPNEFFKHLKVTRWNADKSVAYFNTPTILRVQATAPLEVYSPLLDYKIHSDLVAFVYEKRTRNCQYLGYYFFQDTSTQSEKVTQKNRRQAYFNSSQHFCRSLCAHQLAKNGYRIYLRDKERASIFNLDSCLIDFTEGSAVVGCNNKHYTIGYFPNGSGEPTDLTKKKGRMVVSSDIYFLNDTCFITKEGIIPNNHISFTPTIGAKSIGASLPAEYEPGEHTPPRY
ncbi:carboxypeptidase-like regulatory domain-containing protein [Puteibacter caeruleilacunae]|nr:carboxypeptidase-like regulatory domain-containing protein [Puteibacter caeruleilacunae]